MDSAFNELFGQIGATVVSIAFSLFIGYLLYIKEQRDRIGKEIVAMKREMASLIRQLEEMAIPGVTHSLLSQPEEGEQWDKLSITSWVAGVSWQMRVQVGEIGANDVWNQVRDRLEDLVKGILPENSFPEIKVDSELFREWATNFVRHTEHIEWFCHDFAGYSWAHSLVNKMREWEAQHPNPVLRSQETALLLERIRSLRRLVNKELIFERNYDSLKTENAIGHYKIIIASFLFMGLFSIVIPSLLLLFPPINNEYTVWIGQHILTINVQHVSLASFLCFVFCALLIIWLLMKTVKK